MDGEEFERLTQEIEGLHSLCYIAENEPQDDRHMVHLHVDIVASLMPEYDNWDELLHNPDYHPEGDHSLKAHIHRMVDVYINEKYASQGRHPNDPIKAHPQGNFGLHLLYAILFHDIGKKATAEWKEDKGWHTYIRHDGVGQDVINENYNDLEDDLFRMMEDVCVHHMTFWTVNKERKVRRIAQNKHFVVIAHLCRIDKMMADHRTRQVNGEWKGRCGTMLKAAKSNEKEKDNFIQSCYAIMDMFGVETRWQMTKNGPQALNNPDLPESLDQLLEKIQVAQSLQESMMHGGDPDDHI